MNTVRAVVAVYVFLVICCGMPSGAEDAMVYPTLPGTSIRDHSKPGTRIDGDMLYPTLPGTGIRDHSKPGARIEDDMIRPTLPGTSIRDHSKPGKRIDAEEPPARSKTDLWHHYSTQPAPETAPKTATPPEPSEPNVNNSQWNKTRGVSQSPHVKREDTE